MAYKPEVNVEKCVGSGECVEIFPVDVYGLQDEKSVPVNADECVGCESCIEVCEHEAITVTEMSGFLAKGHGTYLLLPKG